MNPSDPLGVRDVLSVGGESATVFRAAKLAGVDRTRLDRRPWTTRILLENLLRNFDPKITDASTVRALAEGTLPAHAELPFYPGRVLLQDFTGVPVLVDLSAIRAHAVAHHQPAERVNPIVPVDLVIDHSVQVDSFGSRQSPLINLDREFGRNAERYDFLRWAQGSYRNLRIVPPGNGIVHQVNLEYIADVVCRRDRGGVREAFPDTLVGTDSHTTMVNGLGVLGWGVGGIEAEAVMLGEPYFLPPVEVVGVELTGRLPEGATATDLVLTTTRELRRFGVVDNFVEFHGPGLETLSVPDRATISNMCPEYGATAALFPIDAATLAYLRGTGRDPVQIAWIEAYARALGLWHEASTPAPEFSRHLTIDLGTIVPTVSGPRNPEEAVPLSEAAGSFRKARDAYRSEHPVKAAGARSNGDVRDGAVVIAAITSCTNTSNPSVMVGAGLIAKKAVARGLRVPSYVKTSLAPGSKVVTAYLERAHLMQPLEALGFDLVGYGCTTCIGNSGPLPPAVAAQVTGGDLYVAAVLSGNRNFEARVHNQVRANYLASPMLVVAYALAGRVDIDLTREPIGMDASGRPVMLKELWPSAEEVRTLVDASLDPSMFREKYRAITEGDSHWEHLPTAAGSEFDWGSGSTYLRLPPYLDLPPPERPRDGVLLSGGRALALLGDRVSTDHISPAGEIPRDSPAGRYLLEHGVAEAEFNTYGARRGNHEVMVRGTFANVRLKNRLAPGTEGGWTTHRPSGETMTIFDAANRYRSENVPLIVFAGSGYGQGSSRDWAAKGPLLLGVRAVVAKNYERIHRGNLVGMGVLPLQFRSGEGADELQIRGDESFSLSLPPGETEITPRGRIDLTIAPPTGAARTIALECRIDSATELAYYRAGGILPYVAGRLNGSQRA